MEIVQGCGQETSFWSPFCFLWLTEVHIFLSTSSLLMCHFFSTIEELPACWSVWCSCWVFFSSPVTKSRHFSGKRSRRLWGLGKKVKRKAAEFPVTANKPASLTSGATSLCWSSVEQLLTSSINLAKFRIRHFLHSTALIRGLSAVSLHQFSCN